LTSNARNARLAAAAGRAERALSNSYALGGALKV
jgi:hypothetical protein